MSKLGQTELRLEPPELIEAVEGQVDKVTTKGLDVSFNEILDMHESNELNINPDYQRLFQWSKGAQSRFVESLLLEMPVPPIYVIEEENGKYSLIDGLQRISSYLHLRGVLEARHLDPKINIGDYLTLEDCDIVKSINGYTYEDLPNALKIRLKRAFVRMEVVRHGSDPHFKYHMFKRLNTGGQLLSDQQLRNCTIRLLDPRFNDFIIELSQEEDFSCVTQTITTQRSLSAFDQELVLRFFAFKNNRHKFRHDVSDFLTDYMEAVSDPRCGDGFDYAEEKRVFEKTFKILARSLGADAFAFANRDRTALNRGFSVYHFEAITMGVQKYLDKFDGQDDTQMDRLGMFLKAFKLRADFVDETTGGGKNSPGPLARRIRFVEEALEAEEPWT